MLHEKSGNAEKISNSLCYLPRSPTHHFYIFVPRIGRYSESVFVSSITRRPNQIIGRSYGMGLDISHVVQCWLQMDGKGYKQ